MYKFSVITPVHLWNQYRIDMFLKCIESLKVQSFKNFEWIVINDGSTIDFDWTKISEVGNVNLITKPHEERVIAYNVAFKEAQGEWFCLLDSDDEYKPNTLEKLNKLIKRYPKDKMFNFGCVYQHTDGTLSYRDPFNPERKDVGHIDFGGGNIVNGTFMWHRSVYEDLGAYPEAELKNIDCTDVNYRRGDGAMIRDLYMGTPYDFSAAAQLQYPAMRKYFMVDHENEPNKIIKELGNPWGQDYYLFYKYTRKYHSRVSKEYLYIVNPR